MLIFVYSLCSLLLSIRIALLLGSCWKSSHQASYVLFPSMIMAWSNYHCYERIKLWRWWQWWLWLLPQHYFQHMNILGICLWRTNYSSSIINFFKSAEVSECTSMLENPRTLYSGGTFGNIAWSEWIKPKSTVEVIHNMQNFKFDHSPLSSTASSTLQWKRTKTAQTWVCWG